MRYTTIACLVASVLIHGCFASHGLDLDRDAGPPGPRFGERCGEVECGPTEFCCFATGRCASSVDECRASLPDAAPDFPHEVCASSADCPSGEFCHNPMGCLGWGYCRGVITHCTGPVTGVCGCDGEDYPTVGAAEAAGIRVAVTAPCGSRIGGHTVCGAGGTCPAGEVCCAITGSCVRADCPDCCTIRPSGRWGCELDADCPTPEEEVCYGLGCSGPGECFSRSELEPYPELVEDCGLDHPSCGCDGRRYLNTCAAAREFVRIEPGDRSCL